MRQFWFVFLVLAALALSACGGDEKEESASATPTTAATATAAATTGALIDHADASTLDLGQPAPEFTLTDSAGETVSLADYQGEPVLLFFHMADG